MDEKLALRRPYVAMFAEGGIDLILDILYVYIYMCVCVFYQNYVL